MRCTIFMLGVIFVAAGFAGLILSQETNRKKSARRIYLFFTTKNNLKNVKRIYNRVKNARLCLLVRPGELSNLSKNRDLISILSENPEINIRECLELATKFKVNKLPALIFVEGSHVKRSFGEGIDVEKLFK